ncbi:MAG: hypothetical protein ACREAA_20865 [Candidatus Polarisedimenticolia bacterium]
MKLAIPLLVAITALSAASVPPGTAPPAVAADAAQELALLSAASVEVTGALEQFNPCGISLRCDLPGSYIGKPCNHPDEEIPPCYCRALTQFGCQP